jgi:hypothetical protein
MQVWRKVMPKVHSLTMDDAAYEWLQDKVIFAINDFYDDPYGICDHPFGDEPEDKFPKPEIQICNEYKFLKRMASLLKLDFEEILNKWVTPYERNRINRIMEGQTNASGN